jgi:FMN phosphatase YigB (HAD superfamily)
VILSNCDRDLIASSLPRLGVEFADVIVAQDVGSYKPAPGHWRRFDERHPDATGRHVHVGASRFHDIVPASGLGLPSVWINRLDEPAEPRAAVELTELSGLPDALDGLLPA